MASVGRGLGQHDGRADMSVGAARVARVAYLLGVCLVVAGGLVASITGPLGLTRGSWLAAYLVLVCGVAQSLIATAQSALSTTRVPAWVWLVQVVCWNIGNGLIIAGVLLDAAPVVDVGAVPLLVTLGAAIHVVRRPPRRRLIVTLSYAGVLAVLLVSVPVGLVLTHVRGG